MRPFFIPARRPCEAGALTSQCTIPCSPGTPAPRYHAGQAAPPALMQDGHMDALGARSSLLSKLYIRSNVIML